MIRAALGTPSPDRLLKVAQALRLGFDEEQIFEACKIDPWFIRQIKDIVDMEARVREHGLPPSAAPVPHAEGHGLLRRAAGEACRGSRRARLPRGAGRSTCTRSISASTPAPRSSPRQPPICTRPTSLASPDRRNARRGRRDAEKIIILGGGPNRIGQGIEFDYCCCHAAFSLSAAGYETIMVNCNPETVSTDYDTSDRLYFEPLTEEDVLEIVRKEETNGKVKGVIVQFGGQTPLKLAQALEGAQRCRSSAPRPTPSTSPKTATGSRR